MTSFLMLVALLWVGGVVFVVVCMGIIKALEILENNYDS